MGSGARSKYASAFSAVPKDAFTSKPQALQEMPLQSQRDPSVSASMSVLRSVALEQRDPRGFEAGTLERDSISPRDAKIAAYQEYERSLVDSWKMGK